TLKAIKTLGRVDVIFAASSTKNKHSLAVNIASQYLKNDVPVTLLGFPMTLKKTELITAWENNARQVIEVLKKGQEAAFLTLGDPMTYSTFGYLMRTIKKMEPDIPIKAIPGISSFQAGAAAAGHILAEAEESFSVISGALGAENLKHVINHTDNVVVLKVYRNYKEIMAALDDLGLNGSATLISRCGLEDEEIVHDLKQYPDTVPPYLSLLLINRKERMD
ncbi:MAG: precorrin-2 C(20)-methyltransferase, partial [Thermodesulfobacteriota bacterium]|nr:precorrin-2 C(20)-methyltransferase [Thermodesulfobacteriota bacterium]